VSYSLEKKLFPEGLSLDENLWNRIWPFTVFCCLVHFTLCVLF